MRRNIQHHWATPGLRTVGAIGLSLAVALVFTGCREEHPGQLTGENSGRPMRGTPTPGTAYDRSPDGTGTPASVEADTPDAVSGRNTGSGPAPQRDDSPENQGAAGTVDSRGAAAHSADTPEQAAGFGTNAPGDPAEPDSASEADPSEQDEPGPDPSEPVPVDPEPDDPS